MNVEGRRGGEGSRGWSRCLFRSFHILRFWDSAQMAFNKSSTRTRETYRHPPIACSVVFLKASRDVPPRGIHEMFLSVSGEEAHKKCEERDGGGVGGKSEQMSKNVEK